MNYPNEVRIKYEDSTVVETFFDDMLQLKDYTIIDHERLGKSIAEMIFENGKTDICRDDVYTSINDTLSVLKLTITHEIEEHLLNNLGVEVKND